MFYRLSALGALLGISCLLFCFKLENDATSKVADHSNEDPISFNDYWYQGEAEISSYNLEQFRYGEVHPGKAVLVFVTEDFSASKHVKLDYPQRNPEDKVNVLKLNFVRKFNTGIYQYSILQSIFTPVKREEHPHTLKTTTSIQEWCGHVFQQVDFDHDKFNISSYSYFESEGDRNFVLPDEVLEDEIWNLIRINPDLLLRGSFKIIPGSMLSRLIHKEQKVEKVKAELKELEKEGQIYLSYILEYPRSQRTLQINFQKDFPHKILGWEENQVGLGGKRSVTKAELIKTLKTDYWTKNKTTDGQLRTKLGLSQFN